MEKYDSKTLLMKDILSQEEYMSKFYYGETEYIKREYYIDYITQRLSEEFGMYYNDKRKKWCSEWNNNKRFVVELYEQKGTQVAIRWGYNYDFIPDINSKDKLVWHRTESSVKIHLDEFWNNYVEYTRDQKFGCSQRELYNPMQDPTYHYEIPMYTSDMSFALEYIKGVVDRNIPFMREWLNKVKTIDDAIFYLNQKIMKASSFHIPYMCHIRAFLYAKNKDINKAILSMQRRYGEIEIPQVIIKKLNQIADE